MIRVPETAVGLCPVIKFIQYNHDNSEISLRNQFQKVRIKRFPPVGFFEYSKATSRYDDFLTVQRRRIVGIIREMLSFEIIQCFRKLF